MRRVSIYIKIVITAILLVLLVKTFALTSCTIPSTGMENTLYQGERVLVNKWSYGLRLPFTTYRVASRQVKRGDIVLFNNPAPVDREAPVFARSLFISRCIGTPGDTLMLNHDLLPSGGRVLSPDSKALYAYPYEAEDSLLHIMRILGITGNQLVGYSEGRYVRSFSHYEYYLLRQKLGTKLDICPVHEADSADSHPFVIPSKGQVVTVYPWNVTLLCNTILRHEQRQASVSGDTLLLDGHPITAYTFTKDYYWMSSNNPVNLSDSRLFGLVPHDHLVGQAVRIWYPSRKERFFQHVQ